MTRVSITSIINSNFVRQLQEATKISSASSSSSLQNTDASSTSLSSSLTSGSKRLGDAAQNLSNTAGVVTLAEDTLEKLGKLVDKLLVVVERAARSNASAGARSSAQAQFKRLGKEYERIIQQAQSDEKDYLSKASLSEIFQSVGLDSEASDSIASIFESFVVTKPDYDLLADEKIKGKRPIKVPKKLYGEVSTTTGTAGTAGTQGAQATFLTNVSYAALNGTHVVATNSNRDGSPDLVSDGATGWLKVHVGNGDGTILYSSVTYFGGTGIVDLDSADLSKDGKDDIVVTTSTTVNVVRGNGDGTYLAPDSYSLSGVTEAQSSVVYDVNRDGSLDVLTGSTDSGFRLLLGNGNGTFKAAISFNTSSQIEQFEIGDINRDGSLDIAFIDQTSVSFLLGNGDGSFKAATTLENLSSIETLADLVLADIDQDGKLDISVAGLDVGKLYSYRGNGDGTFLAGLSAAASLSDTSDLKSVDINRDGILDLVSNQSANVQFKVLLGNGDFTYKLQTFSNANISEAFELVDFSRDGFVDFIGQDQGSPSLQIILGNTRGTSTPSTSTSAVVPNFYLGGTTDLTVGVDARETFLADYNRDGILDITTVTRLSNTVEVSIGTIDGFKSPLVISTTSDGLIGGAAADVNGDGKVDIIASANISNDTVVLISNGDGTFKAPVSYASAGGNAVSVGDINKDGKLDIAIGSFSAGAKIQFGNGDGTFLAPISLPGGVDLRDIELYDVDRDGNLDIIGNDYTNNTVYFYKGNGNTTFNAGVSIGASASSTQIDLGDINKDGYVDLVTSNLNSDSFTFFLGNGNGTFKAPTSVFVVSNPTFTSRLDAIRLADLNNDGNLDVISGDIGDRVDRILYGNGNGTFKAPVSSQYGGYSIAVGDLNRDGLNDVVSANIPAALDPSKLTIRYGSQIPEAGGGYTSTAAWGTGISGSFKAASTFADGGTAVEGVAVHSNLDGILDYAVVDQTTGKVFILNANGDGTFRAPVSYVTGLSAVTHITKGFNNNDNIEDLYVLGTFGGNTYFTVLRGNGDGTYLAPVSYVTANGVNVIAVGDTTRDGYDDVFLANTATSTEYAFGNTAGTYGAGSVYNFGDSINFLTTQDIDGDGFVDILGSSSTGGKVFVAKGGATATLNPTTIETGLNLSNISLGDINSDGQADLIAVDSSGIVKVFRGGPGGTFSAPVSITFGSSISSAVAGDIDRDGITDLIVTGAASGTVSVLEGNGDFSFKAPVTYGSSAGLREVYITDTNRDGLQDIVTGGTNLTVFLGNSRGVGYSASSTFDAVVGNGNPATNINREIYTRDINGDGYIDIINSNDSPGVLNVALGNGNGTFKANTSYSYDPSWTSTSGSAFGDFDGDGISDVFVASRLSNSAGVLLGNGDANGSFKAISTFNYDGGLVHGIVDAYAIDLNNDGKLDVVAAGLSTSTLDIFYGNGDGTFKAVVTLAGAGSPRDVSAIDVNEDGIKDIVTAQFNGGVGVYLRNSDGSLQSVVSYTTPKSEAQQVVKADINNDGHIDLVVSEFGGGATFSYLLGNGDGSFKAGVSFAPPVSGDAAAIASADFNGDGKADVIVGGYGGNAYNQSLYFGNGNGTFLAPVSILGGGLNITLADVSGDGTTDILSSEDDHVFVTVGSGFKIGSQPFLSSDTVIPVAGVNDTRDVFLADVNSDGHLDILNSDLTAGFGRLAVQLGNGDGTFKGPSSYALQARSLGAVLGDFNRDGYLDYFSNGFFDNIGGILLGNSDGSFKAPVSYSVGNGPAAAYAEDFNGDGKLDLVTASFGVAESTVQVLQGNGDGTFLAPVQYQTDGFGPRQIQGADVDRDGITDLVVANYYSDSISFLHGNGDGTFKAAVSYATSDEPTNLVLKDINKDGKLDVIDTNLTGGGFTIHFGNGDGSFRAPAFTKIGLGADGLDVADYNSDGNEDLLIGIGSGSTITYYGDGTGTFSNPITADGRVRDIKSGDLNHDGILDYVSTSGGVVDIRLGSQTGEGGSGRDISTNIGVQGAASTFTAIVSHSTGVTQTDTTLVDTNLDGTSDIVYINGGTVYVKTGNRDGSFSAPVTFVGAVNSTRVISADFSADGKSDLIIGSSTSGLVFLSGNGSGGFNSPITFGATTNYNNLTFGDYDRDGKLDLVAFDPSSGSNALFFKGNGNGRFAAPVQFQAPSSGSAISSFTGDINRDGKLDLLVTDSSNHIHFLYGNGDGTFKLAVSHAHNTISSSDSDLKDIDGDGILDIVIGTATNKSVNVAHGNGDGTFSSWRSYSISSNGGSAVRAVTIADVNDDGLQDIVASDAGTGYGVVLYGNGNLSFSAPVSYALSISTPSEALVSDFDSDGRSDLLFAGADTNLRVLFGNNRGLNRTIVGVDPVGAFTFTSSLSYSVGTNPQNVVVGDINRDGNLDIVSASPTGATVDVALGNYDGTFYPRVSYAPLSPNEQDVTLFDLDRDGDLDIVGVSETATSLFLMRGNGDGTFNSAVSVNVGVSPESIAVGDVNSDGVADIVVGAASVGTVNVVFGNADGTYKAPTSYSAGTIISDVVLADVNQDGTLDILANNYFDGQVSVLLGNSGASAGTFKAKENAGINFSGRLTTGDYNRDGKIDIAVTKSGTNSYFIYEGLGNGQFSSLTSGIVNGSGSGAYSIQTNDINRDGIDDLVVGNTTTNTLQVLIGNGNGTFKIGVSTTGGTTDVSFLDANGDGIIDVVSTDNVNNTVHVHRGNQANEGGGGRGRPGNLVTTTRERYSSAKKTRELLKIFDGSRDIRNPVDAFRVLNDLKALKKQIQANIKELNDARVAVEDNVALVQATSRALQSVGQSASDSDSADVIAQRIAARVLREGGSSSLNQLDNLNPITVKALLLE